MPDTMQPGPLPSVYQLRVVVRGVSPLIWRRLPAPTGWWTQCALLGSPGHRRNRPGGRPGTQLRVSGDRQAATTCQGSEWLRDSTKRPWSP